MFIFNKCLFIGAARDQSLL